MKNALLCLITIAVWLCVLFLARIANGGEYPNELKGNARAIYEMQVEAGLRPSLVPGEIFLFIARCSLDPLLPVETEPNIFPVPEGKKLVITEAWLDGENDAFLLYDENMDDWYHTMNGGHWQGNLVLPSGYDPKGRIVSETLCPYGGLIVVFFARGYYWQPEQLPVKGDE